jgi:uncharacterized membrane protein
MIIMALDHVRDYFHADVFLFSPTDLSQTSVPLFFTRWITHFCAPVFMFLAGTSAFLVGRRKTKTQLSVFLLKRGLWLMFLDLVVVYLGWSFDLGFHVILFNVIFVFGVSMIILAGLIHLPFTYIFALGLITVIGHNALDSIKVQGNGFDVLAWEFLHDQGSFQLGSRLWFIAYPIIPWFGVMALGYCLGILYTDAYDARERKKWLMILGGVSVLLFVILRGTNIYGDPAPWTTQSTSAFSLLSFLNVTKYPPSLLYLLMTLGPAMLFLAITEKTSGKLADAISVYGRVPLFYYLVHIYVIHLMALIVIQFYPGFSWSDMIFSDELLWFTDDLKGYGFSLWIVYAVWIVVVVGLYPLCKWYDHYKIANKQSPYLSYL